jgi:hypothetical protein
MRWPATRGHDGGVTVAELPREFGSKVADLTTAVLLPSPLPLPISVTIADQAAFIIPLLQVTLPSLLHLHCVAVAETH